MATGPTNIQLSSGRYFDFEEMDPSVITLPVIAHALSNLCRYTGHVSRFYSVAEHSVRASYIGEPEFALERLMHDGAEAFVTDIATPFKRLLGDAYKKYEDRVEAIIAKKWGLNHCEPGPAYASVKHADLIMLATERRDLLPHSDVEWPVLAGINPLEERIPTEQEAGTPWHWRERFIERFQEIVRDR